MRTTEIFFHPIMSEVDWLIVSNNFRHVPHVLKDVLTVPGGSLDTLEAVDEELVLKVHASALMIRQKSMWDCKAARRAVGACGTTPGMGYGRLRNALNFSVTAGHHAGPSWVWGGTHVSCTSLAVAFVRDSFNWEQIAIIDTDSHHGDGTRAVSAHDGNVLHVCFYDTDSVLDNGGEVDADVGWKTSD